MHKIISLICAAFELPRNNLFGKKKIDNDNYCIILLLCQMACCKILFATNSYMELLYLKDNFAFPLSKFALLFK